MGLFLRLRCCNTTASRCPATIFSSVIQVIGPGLLGEKGERGYPGAPGLRGEPGPKGKVLPSFVPCLLPPPSCLSHPFFVPSSTCTRAHFVNTCTPCRPCGDRVLCASSSVALPLGVREPISLHLRSLRDAASPPAEGSLSPGPRVPASAEVQGTDLQWTRLSLFYSLSLLSGFPGLQGQPGPPGEHPLLIFFRVFVQLLCGFYSELSRALVRDLHKLASNFVTCFSSSERQVPS